MEDTKIGLEIHIELDTASKLFCSCPTEAVQPNSATCPTCLGLPGGKPVLNRAALEFGLKIATSLGCAIAAQLVFSRKSYFYPDMAKNFQISQYELPLGKGGVLKLGDREIAITRVHLEEDPAALEHAEDYVCVDYNRSGRPLCEIVTEPELASPAEARAFIRALMTLLRVLRVFDPKRCIIKADANISIAQTGWTRVELKNITGAKEIEAALNHELARQRAAVAAGRALVRETRAWDARAGLSSPLRPKEFEEDYGYIIEPDLPPVELGKLSEEVRAGLPELPAARAARYQAECALSKDDAAIIASDWTLIAHFEELLKAGIEPKLAASWLRKELPRIAHWHKAELEELRITSAELAELLQLIQTRQINEQTGRRALERLADLAFSPKEWVAQQGLRLISEERELAALCQDVIKANAQAVTDFRAGIPKALDFLVGKAMAASRGRADPEKLKEILKRALC